MVHRDRVLAVLAVVLTVAINVFRGGSGAATLPDVRGQAVSEAVATVHDRGLSTRVQRRVDSTVPVDRVIGTEPAADAAVSAGGEVVINVSTGPAQNLPDTALAVVPDVSRLTYIEAIRVLMDAGFLQFQQASLPSPPELEERVVGTNPFADRTVARTVTITVVIGSGPRIAKP